MQFPLTRRAHVAILAPSGHLDGRAAVRFEHDVLELLQGGARFIVVDCRRVSLLAGAGLRVLLLLSRSIEAIHGRLVLCGMDRPLLNVLQVAGLSSQFTVTTSVDEAMSHMPASEDASVIPALAARVARCLSRDNRRTVPVSPPALATVPPPEVQALAARVTKVLGLGTG